MVLLASLQLNTSCSGDGSYATPPTVHQPSFFNRRWRQAPTEVACACQNSYLCETDRL